MSASITERLIAEAGDFAIHEFAIYRHTVYIESVNVGLASTANAEPCGDIAGVGRMQEMTTGDLARMLRSDRIMEAAIGLAAVNASLDLEKVRDRLVDMNAVQILRERGRGGNVSIIGHFPFVESFIRDRVCANVWVFELDPKSPGDLPSELLPQYLPRSDVVLISGTTIINHTLEGIAGQCRNSFNILLGPSTPLTPVLFEFGIDAVCGAIVTDKELAKQSFAQEAWYREARGLQFVCLAK